MKTVVALKSWLQECDLRLDASYHLSEGRIVKNKVKASPYPVIELGQLASKIFYGGRAKRIYVDNIERGVPFLKSSDMLKSDFLSLKHISKKLTKNLSETLLEEDWILVSRSGTIGNTAYVNKDFAGKSASEDMIRIVVNSEALPGFIYSFLSSKYGYALMTQGTFGAVIQHIEPEFLASLPIPLMEYDKQAEIHQLIKKANSLREEANAKLSQAIMKIESQFLIKDSEKIYKVNIKEIKGGDKFTKEARLEADFYSPSIIFLLSQIKKKNFSLLGDLSKEVRISGLRGRTFVKKGVVLVTGQSLELLRLDETKQLSKKFTKKIEENITKNGDILVSVFGTIGKVEYCYNNFYTGVFASQQLARIRVDEKLIHPGYLYLFLKSEVGQKLLLQYKTGSVIEWMNWNNVSSVHVPIPEDKGNALGEIANSIMELRQKALELEKLAIDLVEKEIDSWQN